MPVNVQHARLLLARIYIYFRNTCNIRSIYFFSLLWQVSHHPPAAAHHAISDRGWTLRQEITVASKFRGKYLSIMPLGKSHFLFPEPYKCRVEQYVKPVSEWRMRNVHLCNVRCYTRLLVLQSNLLVPWHTLCFLLPGTIHAIFEKSNNHYTWKKVTTTVHNIIVGKLWIDQVKHTLKVWCVGFGDL